MNGVVITVEFVIYSRHNHFPLKRPKCAILFLDQIFSTGPLFSLHSDNIQNIHNLSLICGCFVFLLTTLLFRVLSTQSNNTRRKTDEGINFPFQMSSPENLQHCCESCSVFVVPFPRPHQIQSKARGKQISNGQGSESKPLSH